MAFTFNNQFLPVTNASPCMTDTQVINQASTIQQARLMQMHLRQQIMANGLMGALPMPMPGPVFPPPLHQPVADGVDLKNVSAGSSDAKPQERNSSNDNNSGRPMVEVGEQMPPEVPQMWPLLHPTLPPFPFINGFVDPNLIINPFGIAPINGPVSNAEIDGSCLNDASVNGAEIKEVITFENFSVHPPHPGAPPTTLREKPLGCKTIFIGGTPENIKEEMIKELFEKFGEINSVRLNSSKKFCHVRFETEESVDQAVKLSGYRIKIRGQVGDPANSGRLHVDYANAKDDQYDYECRQRAIKREQRHREEHAASGRSLSTSTPPPKEPSPIPYVYYSDSEAANVLETLKGENFTQAISVVVQWLERGECNKRNVNMFYQMLQLMNAHIRRLHSEKSQSYEEYNRVREMFKTHVQSLQTQSNQIERLFTSSAHKKVWDHFTKAQRKNIDTWKRSLQDVKNIKLDCDVQEKNDGEKRRRLSDSFKEENDRLKARVDEYKSELSSLRREHDVKMHDKSREISHLQNTLRSYEKSKRYHGSGEHGQKCIDLTDDPTEADTTVQPINAANIAEKEARMIGLISMFLHVHPFGAGLDYICSYLQKMDNGTRLTDVEALMNKFPSVFHQELIGIGASMERRWKFNGLTDQS